MPQSRQSQVRLIDTPYYHCISRCVRRSFLCGVDKYSGQQFRKTPILQILKWVSI